MVTWSFDAEAYRNPALSQHLYEVASRPSPFDGIVLPPLTRRQRWQARGAEATRRLSRALRALRGIEED